MRLRLPAAVLAVTLGLAIAAPGTPTAGADPGPGPSGVGAKVGAADQTARRTQAVAALARVRDVFSGKADPRSATIALRDLSVLRDSLPAALQDEARRASSRPVLSGEQQTCGPHICVHWATAGLNAPSPVDASGNGIPDYVDTLLATMEDVYSTYVGAGYRAPLPDGTLGGNAKTDVYIEDLGAQGLYGYCNSDDFHDPTQGGGWNTWSFCSLDDDYSADEFPTNSPLENLQVTAAHEFFHAVQFAYDRYEDAWVMEATATWAEDELYDAVDDNVQYLSDGPIGYPAVPLDFFADENWTCCHQYGDWIFFRYLTERYDQADAGLPTLVRDLWERLDGSVGGPDDYSMQGLVRILADRGTTMAAELGGFSVWNQFPGAAYSQGDLYPTAPSTKVTVKGSSRNPGAFARTLDHLSAATVRYVPSGLTQSDWRLGLAFDLADKAKGSAAVVTVVKRTGDISWNLVKLDGAGNSKGSVAFSSAKVAAVYVTLLNASTAYTCWASGPYSCQGVAKNDGLKQKVDPVAFRS